MGIRSTPPSCCCICHYRRRVPCNRLTFCPKQCFVGKLHGTSSTQTTRVRLRVSFPKCNADIHMAYRPPLTSAIAGRQQQLAEPNDAWSRWGDARRRHSPTCRLAGSLTVNLNRMVATSTFHFRQRKGFLLVDVGRRRVCRPAIGHGQTDNADRLGEAQGGAIPHAYQIRRPEEEVDTVRRPPISRAAAAHVNHLQSCTAPCSC